MGHSHVCSLASFWHAAGPSEAVSSHVGDTPLTVSSHSFRSASRPTPPVQALGGAESYTGRLRSGVPHDGEGSRHASISRGGVQAPLLLERGSASLLPTGILGSSGAGGRSHFAIWFGKRSDGRRGGTWYGSEVSFNLRLGQGELQSLDAKERAEE